jgi:hypothetical protein
MRLINLIGIIIIAIFLIGCSQIEETEETNYTDGISDAVFVDDADTIDKTKTEEDKESTKPEITGACEPQWKCLGNNYKIYVKTDCSFGEKKECALGCFNNTCVVGKTCDVGFACKDDSTKGYQKEDCKWIKKSECEFGCLKGACLPKPENYTEPVEEVVEVDEDEEPVVPTYTLKMGETVSVNVDDVQHNVSLYILDNEGARIIIDGYKSDFVAMGGTLNYNGVILNIVEITYQPYVGGIQEIVYSLE